MNEKIIYEFDSALSNLKVYEEYCVLTSKQNAFTFLLTKKYFAGEKKFYYSDLTSLQFKRPGKIIDGYIEFEYPGSRSGNNADAYNSENSVTFTDIHLQQMEEIYKYIEEKIRICKEQKNAPVVTISPADEIKKYKELLDMGIITQSEFDIKKKDLLGF